MSKLPRLLPIVFVAVAGVLAMKVITSLDLMPGVFHAAEAFAASKTPAKKAAKTAAPAKGEGDKADDPTEAYAADSSATASAAASAASDAADAVPTVPAPACATSIDQLAQQAGMSSSELNILQSLGQRRQELDQREGQLDSRQQLIDAADAKLDARISQLQDLKGQIQGLLDQANKASDSDTDRLVSVYSAMKPKDAAAVMTTMSDDVALPIAAKMKDRVLASILGAMDPASARALTEKLANRNKAAGGLQQQLDKATAPAGAQSSASASSGAASSAEASAEPAKPARGARGKAKAKAEAAKA